MASFPELRRSRRVLAPAGRSRAAVLASPVVFTAATAVLAVVGLVAVQLASFTDGGTARVPEFLTRSLGSPEPASSMTRRPTRGVTAAVGRTGLSVVSDGRRVSLGSPVRGTWRRFAHGASRPAPFGHESVVVGARRAEEFLTVDRHRGSHVWRWRLHTAGTPRVGADGTVAFLRARRLSGAHVDPVAILDSRGRDVTPKGLRWNVRHDASGWWL